MIGDEFKILPDGFSNEPCKWIIPVEDTEQFTKDDIDTVIIRQCDNVII